MSHIHSLIAYSFHWFWNYNRTRLNEYDLSLMQIKSKVPRIILSTKLRLIGFHNRQGKYQVSTLGCTVFWSFVPDLIQRPKHLDMCRFFGYLFRFVNLNSRCLHFNKKNWSSLTIKYKTSCLREVEREHTVYLYRSSLIQNTTFVHITWNAAQTIACFSLLNIFGSFSLMKIAQLYNTYTEYV